MEFETNRMYRVAAVAKALDVSPKTIYRAIEAGDMDAYRMGKVVRVPGKAVLAYLEMCATAEQVGEVA